MELRQGRNLLQHRLAEPPGEGESSYGVSSDGERCAVDTISNETRTTPMRVIVSRRR